MNSQSKPTQALKNLKTPTTAHIPTNPQNPKVAIIVPFYNVEKYLQDCLESCIHQSYSNI
ncbi:glycosyltransferase family 2 protein, partial [Helicobacter marmotae]|uniref:glycosyltransferase n=1 Tax=Helicobacter marmotae TaxID=152490 RepID=UPI000E1F1594